ncbi:TonB-dependent receptor [Caenimonas aquaedulcis]|uniref:TonB-dependent receptor n=1 Tax=Caenimonas aquaedulcis TaxID=2793270 RepID=A0A931H148_9BURK|nr:TonB-dependent receptor [Caenimonas aquaedulcis]MBG9386618.1 TonB-dependent receptor [Caenimonas aquaedulcis]
MTFSRISTRTPLRSSALSLAFAAAFPSAFAQGLVLPETVVTATRFTDDAQSLPLGVTVVTAAEIRASGASTINEALIRILGIAGRQDFYGGGEYGLDLRGFGGTADNNQVVMVDGMRFSEGDLGGSRLAGIPIESVERIEVIRGNAGVLYGEGATGGVIVVTTKAGAGQQRGNSASVYAGAGSFGARDVRAGGTASGGGFSLDAAAQKRRADNHRDNFKSDSDAVSVTGQWSNDWLRAGARVARDSLDTQLPGALTAAQYEADPRQSTRAGDEASIRNERASLFAEAHVGDWRIAADAGQRKKELRSMNGGFGYDYDVDAKNYALRARHEGKFGGFANQFVVGADRLDWTRDVLGAFGSTARQSSRAVYLKDDVTLAGGTRVSAGYRTERIAKDNTTATAGTADRMHAWELGVSHPFTVQATGYARIGRSYRLANVDEFGYTSPGVILQPQTSRDAEIGARWTAGATKFEARLYRTLVDNEIGFDPNAAGPFGFAGANTNFDPTRRQGVELDVRHAITSTLGVRVNAAVREATFRSGPYAGKDVPLVARKTLAVRADWSPAAQHHVSGGVNWVSSQHPDFNNACTMPAYTTADVRYAYQWQQVELSLGVANLFDRKYYSQAFGCAAGTTTSIYPEAGRAVTAAVRVSF